ncbi:hypothetical protein DFS34DRAFT_597861 [Phlyctochytrium arcticum]|nr:hypothetical protein DFS34DRAFT_597861 [Phlyctochytrium arcticum]
MARRRQKESSFSYIVRGELYLTFRLQGRAFLIPWSQITYNDEPVQQLLSEILPLLTLYGAQSFVRVALERHSDGGFHIHCYCQYANRIDRRLSTQWDYRGKHPDVISKRSRREQDAAVSYLEKDGQWADEGSRISVSATGDSGESLVPDIAAAVADHATFPSWLQFCYEKGVPFGYASEFWRSCRIGVETLDGAEGDEGGQLEPKLSGLSFDVATHHNLVLVGPSGCGCC